MTEEPIWEPHCVMRVHAKKPRRLEHGHVCNGCRHGLKVDLDALVDAAAIAYAIPSPFAAPSDGAGVRGAPGSRPPFDVTHLDPELITVAPRGARIEEDRGALLALLEDWCRIVREDRGLTPYGVATEDQPVTLWTVTRFLIAHVDWMCDTPEFAIEDLQDTVSRGLRALRSLDPTIERPRRLLRVPCPTDVPGEPDATSEPTVRACGERLKIDPGALNGDLVCPACHSEWTPQRLLLLVLDDERLEVWVKPQVAAEVLGITARSLRRYAADGKVPKRGDLYDLGAAHRARRTTKRTKGQSA